MFQFQNAPPTAQETYPGCFGALQLAFIRRGVPVNSLNLMLASLSDSTIKQYSVTFKLWWVFCKQNNIDLFGTSISAIISFLTEQFDKGSSYSTLNTHRSALSLLLGSSTYWFRRLHQKVTKGSLQTEAFYV